MPKIKGFSNALHSVVTGSAKILDENATNDQRNKNSANNIAKQGVTFARIKQNNIETDFVNDSMNILKKEITDESVRIKLDSNVHDLDKTDALMSFYDKKSLKLLNTSPTDKSNLDLKKKFRDLRSREYASSTEYNTKKYIYNTKVSAETDLTEDVDALGNFGDYSSLDEKITNANELIQDLNDRGIYSNEEAEALKESQTAKLTDSILDYYYGKDDFKSAKFVLDKDGVKNLGEKKVLKWRLALKKRKKEAKKSRIANDASNLNLSVGGNFPTSPQSISNYYRSLINSASGGSEVQKSIAKALKESQKQFMDIVSDTKLDFGRLQAKAFKAMESVKNSISLDNTGKEAVLRLFRGYLDGVKKNIKNGDLKANYGRQFAERVNPGDPRNRLTKPEALVAYNKIVSNKAGNGVSPETLSAVIAQGYGNMAEFAAITGGKNPSVMNIGYAELIGKSLSGKISEKNLSSISKKLQDAPVKFLKSQSLSKWWEGSVQADAVGANGLEFFTNFFDVEAGSAIAAKTDEGRRVRKMFRNPGAHETEINTWIKSIGEKSFAMMSMINVNGHVIGVPKLDGFTNEEISSKVTVKMTEIIGSSAIAVGRNQDVFDRKVGALKLGTDKVGLLYFYLPNPNGNAVPIQIEGLNNKFEAQDLLDFKAPKGLRGRSSSNINNIQRGLALDDEKTTVSRGISGLTKEQQAELDEVNLATEGSQ